MKTVQSYRSCHGLLVAPDLEPSLGALFVSSSQVLLARTSQLNHYISFMAATFQSQMTNPAILLLLRLIHLDFAGFQMHVHAAGRCLGLVFGKDAHFHHQRHRGDQSNSRCRKAAELTTALKPAAKTASNTKEMYPDDDYIKKQQTLEQFLSRTPMETEKKKKKTTMMKMILVFFLSKLIPVVLVVLGLDLVGSSHVNGGQIPIVR